MVLMRLKNDFQGKAGERIPHDWLNTIANFWNDLQVVGGSMTRRSDGRFTCLKFESAAAGTTSEWQIMGTIAEHADAAGTDLWTAGGTVGLKFTRLVDIGYDHTAGTPRLFGVKREDTHDRYGNLTAMGTETIVEIDLPISHALLGT